ncbi:MULTISPECIES: hypothetical protein [Streptosporangium]|uniref:Uncharacterized protein n=1 Tax=Streptosporangium brasiliense TaxID=47480 RepID=A0ABT9RLP0_9ACTN|nr:hypothetical protein [Streptosporangium brasiliense]MDP9870219.1 hypothetical protein [Streptosporangium brasiliense]
MAVPAIAEPTPTASVAKATTTPNPVETAKQEAKRQNKPIEIESLHTENSTTIANPDGKTVGTYVYTAPIRVKRDGAWKAIDTTLVEGQRGHPAQGLQGGRDSVGRRQQHPGHGQDREG